MLIKIKLTPQDDNTYRNSHNIAKAATVAAF